jgi:hypothetical protein
MSRYKKNPKPSPETREEAMRIARGTQRPGQTKEQTRLIAQGIQKGIDQYKKQQKARTREFDRQRNRLSKEKSHLENPDNQQKVEIRYKQHWLPWSLLLISWLSMALYLLVFAKPG